MKRSNTSRPARLQSLYRKYFERGIRKLRTSFLRSRAYQLISELCNQNGLRQKICLIVDEMRIAQINRIWGLAKEYFREVRRPGSCVSNVITNIGTTLDEIALECRLFACRPIAA